MATSEYSVVIDGKTVWKGRGSGARTIPAEYLERPANAAPGEPHPPAHFLYQGKTLIGIQISQAEEEGY